MDLISSCRKAISYDTSPAHGTKELVGFLSAIAQDRGLFVETQEAVHDGIEQSNIIIRPTPGRPASEFLFQTHLDTTDPGSHSVWKKTGQNPFDATILDHRIYGLGAADVKLDFICKLEAMSKFSQKTNWKLPPVLLGTFGEEIGMIGAMKIIRSNKVSPRFAIISEPTNKKLVNKAKGIATVEIKIPFSTEEITYRQSHNEKESTSTQSKLFHGKAAHSSMPHLGESAIVKLLDYVLQLPEDIVLIEVDGGTNFNSVPTHAFVEIDPNTMSKSVGGRLGKIYRYIKGLEQEFSLYKDNDFDPAFPTLNIGIIRTTEDHIFISGTCRIPPVVTQSVYEGWMKGLDQICKDNGAVFKVTDYKRPFYTSENSILIKGCLDELKHMGLSHQLTSQASTNEASLFSRLGIDCVCFGPGEREGNIHTPEESVSIDDIHQSIEFYSRLIERFCL